MFWAVLVLTCLLVVGPATPKPLDQILTAPSGECNTAGHLPERLVAGQVIIKLDKSLRGLVEPNARKSVIQVGVPALDELCRRFGVNSFHRIMRHPKPSRLALNMGLDMQYLLSFDVSFDVQEVVREFETSPLVEYACPNALLKLHGQTGTVPPQEGLSPLVPYDTPDDPRYSQQWHLPRIRAPQAWNIAHGDTNVITTVVADGVYWKHPDIEPNLWINHPEDLNHNRRFDALPPPDGDLDGLDQDDNGYPDDVIGWNFHNGTPDPAPSSEDEMGTHHIGVQNAVTDNIIGVAAPPWNVRSMVLKCGAGNVNLAYAIAGIYYSVPEGVRAMCLCFGGPSQHQGMRDACLYAWQYGTVLCAPSGNWVEVRYPAAYEGVLAVTATDTSDHIIGSSAWWVDIAAPGLSILSTNGPDGYGYWSGTTSASNVALGAIAWLKSAYPQMNNEDIVDTLLARADTIGHYRIRRVAMVRDSASGIVEHHETRAWPTVLPPTICRGVLLLPDSQDVDLLDITGRKVMDLKPGENDVRHVAPGVYFIRRPETEDGRPSTAVRKIVIQR